MKAKISGKSDWKHKQPEMGLVEKSFALSLNVLELYIDLIKRNEFEISARLLESSTGIRGKIEAMLASHDDKDFINRVSLATKEAIEARFWLKLVQMNYFCNQSCDTCVDQVNEIINILHYKMQSAHKTNVRLDFYNLN